MAVDPEGSTTVSWSGTYDEQLERSDPQPGFTPSGIIDAATVLCALSYQSPVDAATGVAYTSFAYVRDAGAPEAVQAWAAEHGYEAESQQGWPEYQLPWPDAQPNEQFSIAAKVIVVPVDLDAGDLEEHERRSGLDLQPTDWVVWHVTFTDEER